MRYVLIIATALLPAVSNATSFDCKKAALPVEKLICQNADLGRLDDNLTATFKATQKESGDADPLVNDQKQWLKNERNRCRDVTCLMAAYQQRIEALRKWNEPSTDTDIAGNYHVVRGNFIYNSETQKNEPVKTEDCLSLSSAGQNQLRFSFFLIGANGHTCQMEGVATAAPSGYEFKAAESADKDLPKDCVLRFKVKRNTIELEDVNNACHAYSCGMRASIDGTAFGRKQRSNKTCETDL